jgi:hypothetical protein
MLDDQAMHQGGGEASQGNTGDVVLCVRSPKQVMAASLVEKASSATVASVTTSVGTALALDDRRGCAWGAQAAMVV